MDIFGNIENPFITVGGNYNDVIGPNFGLLVILNNVLRLIFLVAGIFALFQLIFAGFGFMNAGGEPKKIGEAWGKIWQTLLGLVIIVGSFVLAAIIGALFFGNPMAILQPTIYGVN